MDTELISEQRENFISQTSYRPSRVAAVTYRTTEAREVEEIRRHLGSTTTCIRCKRQYTVGDNYKKYDCTIHLGERQRDPRTRSMVSCSRCKRDWETTGCARCMHVNKESSVDMLATRKTDAFVTIKKRWVDSGIVPCSRVMLVAPAPTKEEPYYIIYMIQRYIDGGRLLP